MATSTRKTTESTPAEQKEAAEAAVESATSGGEKAAANQAVDTAIQKDPASRGGQEGTPATPPVVSTAGARPDSSDVVLLGIDADLEGSLYESAPTDELVTLQKDVIEEFYYPLTKRPAQRVLFTAGQTVKKSVIDQLNADAAAMRKAREGGEPELADVIDSTTIASGTGANLPK